MLGMRTCLACHILDRWSRVANWIWPDLAFGFVHKRSGNEIMAALRVAGAPLIMIITITTKIIIIIIIIIITIIIIIIIIIIMKMMMMIKMMTIISEPRKVDRLTSTKEYIKYQHEKQRFTNKLQKYKKVN